MAAPKKKIKVKLKPKMVDGYAAVGSPGVAQEERIHKQISEVMVRYAKEEQWSSKYTTICVEYDPETQERPHVHFLTMDGQQDCLAGENESHPLLEELETLVANNPRLASAWSMVMIPMTGETSGTDIRKEFVNLARNVFATMVMKEKKISFEEALKKTPKEPPEALVAQVISMYRSYQMFMEAKGKKPGSKKKPVAKDLQFMKPITSHKM